MQERQRVAYQEHDTAHDEEPDVICSPSVKGRLLEHLGISHAARLDRELSASAIFLAAE